MRGALIGAPILGFAGLVAGIVAVGMRLPVPALLTTELGAVCGALLGAAIGTICATHAGRCGLLGGLSGLLFALGVALLLDGAIPWHYVLLFVVLGAQGGLMQRQPPPASTPRSIVGIGGNQRSEGSA